MLKKMVHTLFNTVLYKIKWVPTSLHGKELQYDVWIWAMMPTFRRYMLPPSWGSDNGG
jgi:hypothetical protein